MRCRLATRRGWYVDFGRTADLVENISVQRESGQFHFVISDRCVMCVTLLVSGTCLNPYALGRDCGARPWAVSWRLGRGFDSATAECKYSWPGLDWL